VRPPALLGATLAFVLVIGGCGTGVEAESSEQAPTEVLIDYVAAVRSGDGAAVLDLLSDGFVDRYDLTEEKAESSFIPAVQADLSSVGRSLAPAFERQLAEELAVVALRDRATRQLPGPRVIAEPLVRDDAGWRVEPFGLDLVYGNPDDLSADPTRPFVSFGVNTTGVPQAKLWIDGRELPLKRQPGLPIVFAGRPRAPLDRGRHVVVAFAQVGDRVGALAWISKV
jgi:hypothetical protein